MSSLPSCFQSLTSFGSAVAQIERNGTPIEFPIVIPLDNHNSRFDCDVLESSTATVRDALTDEDEETALSLGFRLFFEESNTSGFLQMWDQINKAFHGAYNKARDEYKKQHKSKCELPPTLTPLPHLSHTDHL